MTFKKILILNLLIVFFADFFGINNIFAQIIPSEHFKSEPAKFHGTEYNYLLFYYEDRVSGSLKAQGVGTNTFSWSKYDLSSESWRFLSNGDLIMVSEEGGYRVVVSDGLTNHTYYCWLFVPKLAEIEAFVVQDNCAQLTLSSRNDSIPLIYYHPTSPSFEFDNYERTFMWEAIPAILDKTMEQAPTIKISSPFVNTTYKVSVTDKFQHAFSSEVVHEAIAVSAKIRAEILKADIPHEVHDSIDSASAPLEMRCYNESEGNFTSFQWAPIPLSLYPNPLYVFTEPKDEIITLTVSNAECESADSLKVTVMESLLEFPNVFTPNGDGINDEFRCVYRSLKKYEITIINRWGRVVYKSTDPSKGWDGNVGGQKAPPGVYFFHATAEGYKKGEKHKKTGPVHLIREK